MTPALQLPQRTRSPGRACRARPRGLLLDLTLPFDRASHAGDLRGWTVAGFGNKLHGLEQIPAGIRHRRSPGNIVAPAILQFKAVVEAEKIGRAHGVVSARDFLSFVEQVGEGKLEVASDALHVLERIFRIVPRVIGTDRLINIARSWSLI